MCHKLKPHGNKNVLQRQWGKIFLNANIRKLKVSVFTGLLFNVLKNLTQPEME